MKLDGKKLGTLLIIAVCAAYPYLTGQSGYYMTLFVTTCVFAMAAMALNLLTGYGGQISVGHAGFLMAGGYTVGLLGKAGFPRWIALPAAGVVAALFSLIIGLAAVRLTGHFLAVTTLGFGLSVPLIALKWESLTNGYSGIAVLRPDMLSSDLNMFYFVLLVTILTAWILSNIVKSGMGRAFVAIRESEVAAQASGIPVAFYKTVMFAISAFFTGIAGGINALWIGFISPSDYSIVHSLFLLAIIVVGGLASIPGAIIGAVIYSVIPHFTDSFIGITNMVIGVAVILIIFYRSEGLVSIFRGVRLGGAKTARLEAEGTPPKLGGVGKHDQV